PLATLEAYQDHGQPAARLETDLGESYRTLSRLSDLGIDLDDIAVQLETEGVQKFSDPHAETLQALDRYRQRFGVSVSVLP
ncbi:MAG TPA: transaldolase family protein, partial [Anaerolineae bacterium]|nr:transaldolase family protein [Anaerolineae bacterium]